MGILQEAPAPYPIQQHAPVSQESKDEEDLYSGFGAEEVAAPLQTEDLEYDQGFQVQFSIKQKLVVKWHFSRVTAHWQILIVFIAIRFSSKSQIEAEWSFQMS